MYDVTVVGYGPTGMMAAILLARSGHRVAVVERHTSLYNLPRVGIVHDDVMRMFQEIGCVDDILPSTFFLPTYELARNGKLLMSSEVAPVATHGWPEFISIYQPAFEKELDRLVRSEANVDLLLGQTAMSLAQDGDSVTITAEDPAGVQSQIESRFLVGADGGNSFVRQALGVEYERLGIDQDWLVIDALAKRPQRPELPYLRQFCEPEQPGMTMRMGPDHRRWSFMILSGETSDEATKPENVWRRLARPEGGSPDEFELIRVVTYKFQSLVARSWRKDRVLLAGDAAHQMPPFLAQGLCSGLRDAHNLAWKLDLVLTGVSPDAILDTYEAEREPHARATVIESALVGENVIERDLEKARQRDERLLALSAQMQAAADKRLIAYRVPGIKAGLMARHAAAAGDTFPQAMVVSRGVHGRFDDLAGRGFLMLARNADPESVLTAVDLSFWRALGGRTIRLDDGSLLDSEGVFTRLLDEYHCDVIVKRPDNYIFGAASSIQDVPELMADLRDQLSSGMALRTNTLSIPADQ
ncbi:MAG TPA: bifunctional 3-(3-hydroxy-phenyl)propionate/3-hydroxycinnamic acid hydroxylase [Dehalococcoidia bacterium]|nr:bifunctional 3-(3-hydroxy-phenyl)propionate/3-hydroxycinnamic acid hydroxylase [Dehalococcoidia bacterium]